MPNTLVIKQNSTDISNAVIWSSLQATLVLTKEISKVQFSVLLSPVKPTIALGDQIDLYQNSVHIFGGTVTESEVTIDGGILSTILVTCTDWSFKLNKLLVAKTYAAMDPHDIIVDLITNYTDGSYTTTNVAVGNFLVPSIKFNYEPVTACIQKLATLIGWDWYVDANKGVHFFIAENTTAPFNIDDTNGNVEWPTIDIDQDLTNLKNSVFVIGGLYKKLFTSVTTPDVYLGDGTKQVFSTAYTYDNDDSFVVTLNGSAQTVGIENQTTVPGSVQVLWNPAGRYIIFNSVPTAGQVVKVYGNAKIPILAHAQDSAGIAAFGEVQSSIIDNQITTIAEAQARAKAEILQYGHAVYTVKFNTIQPGLMVGQTILLNSTKLGFTNIPLTIKRLTGNGYSPTQIEWQVEAYGSDQVTFVDIMAGILQQNINNNTVDDTTIIEVIQTISEAMTFADAVSASYTTGPYNWGPTATKPLIWSFGTWS